jgi:DNA-binding transcriptional LysR family regulator
MSLRQFEYALAVAEQGSVTAAAEVLRVAQPSVSQQIRGLERDLGVELFSRTPTGLVPTVAGRSFLREAEIALNPPLPEGGGDSWLRLPPGAALQEVLCRRRQPG